MRSFDQLVFKSKDWEGILQLKSTVSDAGGTIIENTDDPQQVFVLPLPIENREERGASIKPSCASKKLSKWQRRQAAS